MAEAVYGRRKLTKTRLYDLPRSDSETNVNDYNPAVLLAWCGNMDLQFIGEKSGKLTDYITKYQTKAEKSFATEDFEAFFKGKSAASNLWSFAMSSLSKRECGALEAADTLLQIPLFGHDNESVIRWVNVGKVRTRKVKAKEEMEKLQDDDTDIFCPNMIDVHYPKRSAKLKDMNLYDFLRHFDIVDKKPLSKSVNWHKYGKRFLRQRKHPYLLNYYKFNPKTQADDYYFSLLFLFKPWTCIDELKGGCENYTAAFDKFKGGLEAAMQYHDNLNKLREAREQFDRDLDELENNPKGPEDEDENILGFEIPLQDELNGMDDLAQKENDVPLDDLIAQLNKDQRRIFDEIVARLNGYYREWQEAVDNNEKLGKLNNPRLAPAHVLRKFISGVGGTGKSFLINVIRKYVLEKLEQQVIVAGPTGIAARNVNGLTIHRLLSLPVEHGGIPKYVELNDAKLES